MSVRKKTSLDLTVFSVFQYQVCPTDVIFCRNEVVVINSPHYPKLAVLTTLAHPCQGDWKVAAHSERAVTLMRCSTQQLLAISHWMLHVTEPGSGR